MGSVVPVPPAALPSEGATDLPPPDSPVDPRASARIAELETEIASLRAQLQQQAQLETALRASEARFRALISSLQVGIVVQGAKSEILLCNAVSLELLGLTEEEYLGRTSFDPRWQIVDVNGQPFPGEQRPVAQVLRTRREVRDVVLGIYRPRRDDWVWLLVNAVPQFDERGEVQQIVSTFTDITALRKAEERTNALTRDLLALSTPCIPISDGVVIIPLIGYFDRSRSEHAVSTLLTYVRDNHVRVVILDLTGLSNTGRSGHDDSQAVRTLQHLVAGMRLLGAPVLLTGIRAQLAQDLIRRGNALTNIPIYSTLQHGVAAALAKFQK